ncbi:MAG TPA: hypothetical protein VKT53_00735 [Candidatus Acidoferrum sp.]|nr:hypothetical protein [Candidatus Acidoferrum sp.]
MSHRQEILSVGEDSRLKGYAGRTTHAIFPLERTYCTNCGKPYGWASQESSEHIAAAEIIVFCEQCFELLNGMGRLPMRRVPTEDLQRLGLREEALAR